MLRLNNDIDKVIQKGIVEKKSAIELSYATVKRLVKEICERHKEAFIRQEYD